MYSSSRLLLLSLLLVLGSLKYIPNKQISIPQQTFKLLYSNSQKYLMVASESEVTLYHGVNGSKINNFDLDGKSDASSIAISNDNSQFAIGFNDGEIYLYKQGQFIGQKLETIGTSRTNSMCFTSDNQHLVIGVEDQHFQIYNFQKQSSLTDSFENIRIFAVACSPVDATSFVVGGGEDTRSKFVLYDFDFDTSNISNSYEFPAHENGTVLDAAFSDNGESIYRAGGNGNVSIYTLKQNKPEYDEEQFNVESEGTLFQISVSTDKNIIATVNETNAILIYPNQDLLKLVIDADIQTTSETVVLAPKGEKLIVIGTDGTADILGQCPLKEYIDINGDCQPCIDQCDICQDSSNNCYECIASYYLDEQNCLTCGDGCLECNEPNNCLNCDASKNFVIKPDGNCGCQDTYYDDAGQCKLCSEAIVGCVDCSDDQTCTQCDDKANRELVDTKCLCKPSYYEDSEKICQLCDIENCLECSDATTCTKCADTFYNDAGTCRLCSEAIVGCRNCDNSETCTQCDASLNRVLSQGQCICQDGFYDKQGACTLCDIDHCLKCSDATTCTQCNYIDHWKVNETNQCSCMSHYIQIEDQCVECPIGCSICQANGTCTQCDVDEHFQKKPIQGQCQCASGFYFNDTQETCDACSVGCKNCTEPDICEECDKDSHFVMVEGEDRCQCQPQYLLISRQCALCDSLMKACDRCETKNKCTHCRGETSLSQDNSSCTCPAQKFINEEYKCQNCPEECEQCENLKKCTKCKQGYDLDQDDQLCKSSGLDALIIILIVVGVIVVIGAVVVIFKCIQKKKPSDEYQKI